MISLHSACNPPLEKVEPNNLLYFLKVDEEPNTILEKNLHLLKFQMPI
jgi:hypothetical protein